MIDYVVAPHSDSLRSLSLTPSVRLKPCHSHQHSRRQGTRSPDLAPVYVGPTGRLLRNLVTAAAAQATASSERLLAPPSQQLGASTDAKGLNPAAFGKAASPAMMGARSTTPAPPLSVPGVRPSSRTALGAAAALREPSCCNASTLSAALTTYSPAVHVLGSICIVAYWAAY